MNLVQSDITGTHMKVHKVKGTVMPGSQAIRLSFQISSIALLLRSVVHHIALLHETQQYRFSPWGKMLKEPTF